VEEKYEVRRMKDEAEYNAEARRCAEIETTAAWRRKRTE
jgi:hypothetical protein